MPSLERYAMTKTQDAGQPPLPYALRKAAAELRSTHVPVGFHARLAESLAEADQTKWRSLHLA